MKSKREYYSARECAEMTGMCERQCLKIGHKIKGTIKAEGRVLIPRKGWYEYLRSNKEKHHERDEEQIEEIEETYGKD